MPLRSRTGVFVAARPESFEWHLSRDGGGWSADDTVSCSPMVIELQPSLAGKANHLLSADMTRTMLAPVKVIMTNSDTGEALCREILGSIAREYR